MAKAKLKISISNEVLKTYQFYTKNGKRMAIFAVPDYVSGVSSRLQDGILTIYAIQCSEKDQFDRNIANIAFSIFLGSPTASKKLLKLKVEKIGEVAFEGGKSKKEFLRFCRARYCVLGKMVVPYEHTALYMNNIPVKMYKDGKPIVKLSHPINK